MSGAKSNLWCPICRSTGGSLTKRQVKRAVYLPKLKDIKTVSEAWDYAAKVCLRMHKTIIRFPLDSHVVKVMDYRYYHYQEVIKRYTDNNNNSLSRKNQKLQLLVSAYKILEELGFKTNHIHDKIKSNIRYFIDRSN